jgi:bifunctional DNA-binding transcriptional regulator/antitoxin component of YhaV-PrlF toxin-antitoxin module
MIPKRIRENMAIQDGSLLTIETSNRNRIVLTAAKPQKCDICDGSKHLTQFVETGRVVCANCIMKGELFHEQNR